MYSASRSIHEMRGPRDDPPPISNLLLAALAVFDSFTVIIFVWRWDTEDSVSTQLRAEPWYSLLLTLFVLVHTLDLSASEGVAVKVSAGFTMVGWITLVIFDAAFDSVLHYTGVCLFVGGFIGLGIGLLYLSSRLSSQSAWLAVAILFCFSSCFGLTYLLLLMDDSPDKWAVEHIALLTVICTMATGSLNLDL